MKGIIWDLDGTFYDPFIPSMNALVSCFERAVTRGWIKGENLQRLKRRINGEEMYLYKFWKELYEEDRRQGGVVDFSLKLIFERAWFNDGSFCPKKEGILLTKFLENMWFRDFFSSLKPFFWVHKTLYWLRNQGISMGMISDSPVEFGKEKIKALKLEEFFDSTNTIWNREKLRTKPGKESFIEMSKWMNLAPHQVLVVGDVYTKDGIGARNAGMSFLAVNGKNDFSLFLKELFTLVEEINE